MDVIVTFDLDNISCNNKNYQINNPSFAYDNELKMLFKFFEEKDISATAFVRIDNQIKKLFSDQLYVLNLIPENNLNLEIGWHPHIYEEQENTFITSKNHLFIANTLLEIYNTNPVVRDMTSVRIGGCQMNNAIMGVLNNMGFKVDSSALPGCRRNDNHRYFDWFITGNTCYHPSIHDYRCSGGVHHSILEVPMTTMMTTYDNRRRYINPTIKKEIFQPSFENFYHLVPYLAIVFHPDQLIDSYEDDLYRYGFSNFLDNWNFLEHKLKYINYQTLTQFHAKI